MKLSDILHAPTRQAWNARLIVYIAVVVTLCAVFQIAKEFWL